VTSFSSRSFLFSEFAINAFQKGKNKGLKFTTENLFIHFKSSFFKVAVSLQWRGNWLYIPYSLE